MKTEIRRDSPVFFFSIQHFAQVKEDVQAVRVAWQCGREAGSRSGALAEGLGRLWVVQGGSVFGVRVFWIPGCVRAVPQREGKDYF